VKTPNWWRRWRWRKTKAHYKAAFERTLKANEHLARSVRHFGEQWTIYRLEIIKLNRAVVRRNNRIKRLKAALDAAREGGEDGD
jgi:hypothetical protein